MRIEYDNSSIKKLFTDLNAMKAKVGADITKAIKKRCDSLKAADNLAIFFQTQAGRPENLSGDLEGYCSVKLTANYRLIFRPESEGLSMQSYLKCDTVTIKGVDDYHGGKSNWLIP